MFWDLSTLTAKDLVAPILVFAGLILNGVVFNPLLERWKGKVAVTTEHEKVRQKAREEKFELLINTSSMAASATKTVLGANKHSDREFMIDALLPGLTRFWTHVKTLNFEMQTGALSKEDVLPFVAYQRLLVEFFFMLDNTKFGSREYVDCLTMQFQRIKQSNLGLREHASQRRKVLA